MAHHGRTIFRSLERALASQRRARLLLLFSAFLKSRTGDVTDILDSGPSKRSAHFQNCTVELNGLASLQSLTAFSWLMCECKSGSSKQEELFRSKD
jgi:hypothetical protein